MKGQARRLRRACVVLGMVCIVGSLCAPDRATTTAAAAESRDAWLNRGDVFPIAVWLQSPHNAARYKQLGINLYVGLWRGPTEEQLSDLKKQGMALVCSQNALALQHLDDPNIVGWMHGDEPDNAQSLGDGKGYGPPIPAERIVDGYRRIKERDPSRPVLLNLGQGVAWDGWYGRGVRTNHPEDYPQYVLGCDIASFDIYPAVHDKPPVAGKLWFVARGVSRLRTWTEGKKPVWNCIECTRISNRDVKPTPAQVKAEVWMSIVHGSQGLIYFCHQFEPQFVEAGLLADEEMAQAVREINAQIQALSQVIRGPSVSEAATVVCDPPRVSAELAEAMTTDPVAFLVKKHEQATYLFSVRMENSPAKATFRFREAFSGNTVEVLGEGRTIELEASQFSDEFAPHAVHLYKIH